MIEEVKDIAQMSFEEALGELEAIVRRLEEGKAQLDEAITFYERGTLLKKHCEIKLQSAQARVEQIIVGEGGVLSSAPVDFS